MRRTRRTKSRSLFYFNDNLLGPSEAVRVISLGSKALFDSFHSCHYYVRSSRSVIRSYYGVRSREVQSSGPCTLSRYHGSPQLKCQWTSGTKRQRCLELACHFAAAEPLFQRCASEAGRGPHSSTVRIVVAVDVAVDCAGAPRRGQILSSFTP